jgi:hypothetical protein
METMEKTIKIKIPTQKGIIIKMEEETKTQMASSRVIQGKSME